MGWWNVFRHITKLMSRFPWIPILVVWVITLTCGPFAFYYHLNDISDFSNYRKGMEPRGTEKGIWSLSVKKLENRSYTLAPTRKFPRNTDIDTSSRKRRDVTGSDPNYQQQSGEFFKTFWEVGTDSLRNRIENGETPKQSSSQRRRKREEVVSLEVCLERTIQQKQIRAMVVETSNHGGDLLSPEALHAMCQMENEYILPYADIYESDGCPPHSLPLYIGALNEVTCDQINQQHVDYFRGIMKTCSEHYETGKLQPTCTATSCKDIPPICYKYQAVYKTLHFLADKYYPTSSFIVTKAIITLPQKEGAHILYPMLNYYLDHLDRKKLDNGVVKITGMELGIKYDMFNQFLLGDLPYFGLAGAFILVILFVYLRSVVLLSVTLINVIISFAVSYFLYFYVFQLKFFPFINIFAGLILIAVGADDIFVLKDIWDSKKYDKNGELVPVDKVVHGTLKHGALSIFVTSLTTAAAFIANYVHTITAIRLFGIFAATCILVNFVFMITFVIGVMIIIEKIERTYKLCNCACLGYLYSKYQKFNDKIYKEYLPKFITKPAPGWVFLLTVVGTAGLILIFATPTLKLPSTENFQVMQSDHPMELYVTDHKNDFRFESVILDAVERIYVDMVWGVKGQDNGDWLDPDNTGELIFNQDFDYYHPDSIIYLRDLCRDLMTTTLVGDPERYLCFFDAVENAAAGSCDRIKLLEEALKAKVETNCCEVAFPGSRELNEDCIVNLLTENLIFHTLGDEFYQTNSKVVGLTLFDQNNTVKAFKYIFRSNMVYTNSFTPMKEFYTDVAEYMSEKVKIAPKSMSSGWFTGAFEWAFFVLDFQESVASGALTGIGLSLAVGFVVLVVTSPNIVLNLFAIISIGLTIGITVGSLAAMGWELNIVESLTITLSVGLSIDFTIHYSVAYRISKASDRKLRVYEAIGSVGSAVSMGALTTFLTGVAVVPGRLLIYTRFGIFLMVVMAASWFFANFFFLSLCSFVGPQGNTGEILAPCKTKKEKVPKSRKSKVYQYILPHENLAAFWSTLNWSTIPSPEAFSADIPNSDGTMLAKSRQSAYLSKDTPEFDSSNPTLTPVGQYNRVVSASMSDFSSSDRSVPYSRFSTGTTPGKVKEHKLRRAPDHGVNVVSDDPGYSFIYSRLGLSRPNQNSAGSLWAPTSSIASSLPTSESNIFEALSAGNSDSVDPENDHDFQISNASNDTRSTRVGQEENALDEGSELRSNSDGISRVTISSQ